jgi:predicted dehydrogenase
MEPVKALLLGAGSRGTYAYAEYARMNPKMMRIVAVAEPDTAKRNKIQEDHHIPDNLAFTTWEAAFKPLPDVEAVIIATQDKNHAGPLMEAMAHNLHIICEKPIAPTLEECRTIEKASSNFTKVFMICHVLKYTPFFSKIKELLDAGQIGRLVGINLIENVGHIHLSHSFVRGNWRNKTESSPMILAKSCHDMDMLIWLAGDHCKSLNSFGDLHYFTSANAPPGAPKRCFDGCPHMLTCPYHVSKIYLTEFIGWPVNVITTNLSIEGRIKALETGPYGRCVYYCDNDVVDHQILAILFTNGVKACFTMSGFTMKTHRGITLFGTQGEITGDMEEDEIQIKDFSSRNLNVIHLAQPVGGHSGGDVNLMTDFVHMIRGGEGTSRTAVRHSFESHYMAFAAEYSRLNGAKTIDIEKFRKG